MTDTSGPEVINLHQNTDELSAYNMSIINQYYLPAVESIKFLNDIYSKQKINTELVSIFYNSTISIQVSVLRMHAAQRRRFSDVLRRWCYENETIDGVRSLIWSDALEFPMDYAEYRKTWGVPEDASDEVKRRDWSVFIRQQSVFDNNNGDRYIPVVDRDKNNLSLIDKDSWTGNELDKFDYDKPSKVYFEELFTKREPQDVDYDEIKKNISYWMCEILKFVSVDPSATGPFDNLQNVMDAEAVCAVYTEPQSKKEIREIIDRINKFDQDRNEKIDQLNKDEKSARSANSIEKADAIKAHREALEKEASDDKKIKDAVERNEFPPTHANLALYPDDDRPRPPNPLAFEYSARKKYNILVQERGNYEKFKFSTEVNFQLSPNMKLNDRYMKSLKDRILFNTSAVENIYNLPSPSLIPENNKTAFDIDEKVKPPKFFQGELDPQEEI